MAGIIAVSSVLYTQETIQEQETSSPKLSLQIDQPIIVRPRVSSISKTVLAQAEHKLSTNAKLTPEVGAAWQKLQTCWFNICDIWSCKMTSKWRSASLPQLSWKRFFSQEENALKKWRQFHQSPTDPSTCKKPKNAHFLQAAVRAKIGGHKVAQRIAKVACVLFSHIQMWC